MSATPPLARVFASPLARFVVVGCSNAALTFMVFRGTFALLGPFAYKALAAQLVAYALGTLWSFYWNRRWSFRAEGALGGQFLRFVGLQSALAAASAGALHLVVDRLGMAPSPSWLAVMVLVTAANYFASRYWAFRAH